MMMCARLFISFSPMATTNRGIINHAQGPDYVGSPLMSDAEEEGEEARRAQEQGEQEQEAKEAEAQGVEEAEAEARRMAEADQQVSIKTVLTRTRFGAETLCPTKSLAECFVS